MFILCVSFLIFIFSIVNLKIQPMKMNEVHCEVNNVSYHGLVVNILYECMNIILYYSFLNIIFKPCIWP